MSFTNSPITLAACVKTPDVMESGMLQGGALRVLDSGGLPGPEFGLLTPPPVVAPFPMCRRNGQEGRPKWWNDSHVSSLCIYYFTKPRYGTFSSKPRPTNFSSRSSSDRLLLVPYTSFPSTLTTICLILTLLLFSRLSFFFFKFLRSLKNI